MRPSQGAAQEPKARPTDIDLTSRVRGLSNPSSLCSAARCLERSRGLRRSKQVRPGLCCPWDAAEARRRSGCSETLQGELERFSHFPSSGLIDAAKAIEDPRIAESVRWYEELYYF